MHARIQTHTHTLTSGPTTTVTGGLAHPLVTLLASPPGKNRYAPLLSLPLVVPYVTKSMSISTLEGPFERDLSRPVVPENFASKL